MGFGCRPAGTPEGGLTDEKEDTDMPQVAAEKAGLQVGETLEEMAQSASRFKSSVSDAVDDNVHRVRRAARRTRYAAEDLIYNAAYKVRRHPFEAVAIAAGTGFAIGFLVGLAVNRE
jgi:ElaB/YqjD/DUF883 family membrane-anchored ribosome-binding protein